MPTGTTEPRTRIDRRTRSARAQGRDGRGALLDATLEVLAERGYAASSIDEICERAGYSKGSLYWHFSSKDDLFFALLDERVDRPWREAIDLLASAPASHDMAPEASRRFAALVRGQRDALLLNYEYWSQAVRDRRLATRWARRRRELRAALASATVARLETLGAPAPDPAEAEQLATAFMTLVSGLAQERLVEPRDIPDDLLGSTFALLYAGYLTRRGS